MHPFTLVVYSIPAGGHHVESVPGLDATDAVIRLRERLELGQSELEVVAVIAGTPAFERVDATRVALAPYAASSP